MKMRSLLLLALVVSACNGTTPALPVSPSGLAEAPLLRTDPSSPAAPMPMEMGADDFESPQDLASETTGELSVEAFFDSVLATEPDVAGTGLDVTGLDGGTTAAGPPGRPVIVSASAKGNSVTFSWKRGATGGAPKEYFVVYKGLTKPVNLSTSFSFTATPGRYLVGVYAKNDAGKGPLATTEVTVGAGRSVYDGTFFGSGTIIRTFGIVTCRWHHTYRGKLELITDHSPNSGLVGIMKLTGSSSEPRGFSSHSWFTCLAGQRSYTDIKPVIISGTNIARTGLLMGVSTGTFSGNLLGTRVTGTLKAVYKNGFGTLTMPVVLTK